MWGRFGRIDVEAAPRRRIAGLVSVGLDRLVVPMAGAELLPTSFGTVATPNAIRG
jgi:hypothetical protein